MVEVDKLLRPLQVPLEMREGRAHGEPRASVLVGGNHDFHVVIPEFHKLFGLVQGRVLLLGLHWILVSRVLRACLGGGAGPKATEGVGED